MNWTALIDVDAAQKAGACREGLRWARAKPRTFAELAKHRPNWLGWYAVHVPGLSLADRIAMVDRTGTRHRRYWYGEIAPHAPDITPRDRLRLIQQSDDPAFWIGYVASRAPGLSLWMRLAWAKRSDSPLDWRDVVMDRHGKAKAC